MRRMDQQGNGQFDLMENRLQCGGLRYKSKVPRARGIHQQRPDNADCAFLKRDILPPPTDHHSKDYPNRGHPTPPSKEPSPRDPSPSLRYQYSSPRDYPPIRKSQLPPRDHHPLPKDSANRVYSPKDYFSSPRDPQGMLGVGDTDEQKEWRQLVGQRVCISGVKQGTLRYFGRTNFAQGHWCGVELDEPVGKNDGTVAGIVYFACRPNHGIFAPVGKVSRLNDTWDSDHLSNPDDHLTSTMKSECAMQPEFGNGHHRNAGWEHGMVEPSQKKYIRSSMSDPTFMQGNAKPAVPRNSESFSFDKRYSEDSKHFEKVTNSSSSQSLGRYGYAKKDKFASSNVIILSDNARETVHQRQKFGANGQSTGLTSAMEEYEHFLRTPTNSGQASPMSSEATVAKRFNEMPFYTDYNKMPGSYLRSFQPHDFSDFEDEVDNDDQMSVEYDESLGILTPSQMKDLTLGPSSLTDLKGMDFPSSESFDDINDLPEDEQVHDVSVFRVSEQSTARSLEVSKHNGDSYSKSFKAVDEKRQLSSTDKFLSSISQKDLESFPPKDLHFNSSDSYPRTSNTNDLVTSNGVCFEGNGSFPVEEIPDKCYKTFSKEEFPNISQYQIDATVENDAMEVDQKSALCSQVDCGIKETVITEVNPRMSLNSNLSVESEGNTTLKEKLTVSWEDCLPRDSECMFPHVERPESVYTVGSSDTGFQEDGELETDAGMTTSVESTDETKRFSLASRDSCIVSDEADAYKIAESNSTSGYSTGLSDSCCNDRPEDDLSSKPLTDEEIQDSVGHCDSEDAFSFQENSLGKDGDVMTMETSEVTTALNNNNNESTSDALCETMVEDSTLTEINELLLSPEEGGRTPKSPPEAKEMDVIEELPQIESQDMGESKAPSVSTPEKKPNLSRTRTVAPTRNASAPNRTSRASREEDLSKRRQQQVVPKSPKKNVMSKIKAMIEATSCKSAGKPGRSDAETPAVTRRAVSAPKKSRWEAVTSKIAASLAEEKVKPKERREIKSRVDTNLTSARQLQQVACRSPKLDSCRASNCGDGSMSPPVSVCSRDKRTLVDKNSAPNSVREGRASQSREQKQRPKSPRPGRLNSRSASPVAASESSTASASFNSKSKIAHWKGSNSTIASSVPPPPLVSKRPPPIASTKAASLARTSTTTRPTNGKKPPVPKIRITPSERSQSPAVHSRSDNNRRHSRTKEHATRGRVASTHLSTSKQPVRPPMWLSKAELTQEIQRLGTLCEARTKELNRLKMETKHVTVGFDAFAALFKYMVEDVNGLSVPKLSEDLNKTLKQLELAKQDLAYYEREVEEMKAHHCQELNDLSNKLFEVFQGEVTELGAKHQEEINSMKLEHEQQLKATSETYEAGYEESRACHEAAVKKMQQELNIQREELQLFHEKELQDLEEKHSLNTQTLQEHIEQLQKKCAELKLHSMDMEDAMRKDTDTKLQWVTSKKGDLEKEVESLKAVLEMKNKELHTLRVQNLEMQKQLEELPLAREKIKMLSARAEDLEALMIEKTRLERKLSSENQVIKDTYEKESKVNMRLSMENEELQWRLRQAEQSFVSASFSEVPESTEETENETLSPVRSPPQLSRSVFFTFIDKDNTSSPRSQYKKITPGFSSGYKTSPSKSCKSPSVPSPLRNRGLSDSSVSTPKKGVKATSSLKQKRQRASTTVENGGAQSSFASSMVSSVGSECSVFDQREGLLEEHQEQIMETLEILREQRCSEENDGESTLNDNWQEGASKNPLEANQQEQNGDLPKGEAIMDVSRSQNETGLPEQCTDSLPRNGEKTLPVSEPPSDATTPSDKSEEVTKNGAYDMDEMSRSAEFSDPKTYYHMTFNVMKESGDGDVVDRNKTASHSSTNAQATHSMVEACVEVVSPTTQMSKALSAEVVMLEDATALVEMQQNALVQSCHSATGVSDCNREKNRWRTM